jgi:hypothetical protein
MVRQNSSTAEAVARISSGASDWAAEKVGAKYMRPSM